MIYIANFDGKNIYSNDAAKKMDMGISSVSRALSSLLEKDYIEKGHDNYYLIVPVCKILLKK